jgi:Gpi16 subunit, GPI transamidase component
MLSIKVNMTAPSNIQVPIPSWITPYYHKMKILLCDGRSDESLALGSVSLKPAGLFVIATDYERSCFSILIPFDKSLLHYSEYPPDANKGFDFGYNALSTCLHKCDCRRT